MVSALGFRISTACQADEQESKESEKPPGACENHSLRTCLQFNMGLLLFKLLSYPACGPKQTMSCLEGWQILRSSLLSYAMAPVCERGTPSFSGGKFTLPQPRASGYLSQGFLAGSLPDEHLISTPP